MEKFNKNIEKVILELSHKNKDSREFKKYQKILAKKYNESLRFKKIRTREKSLEKLEEFKKMKEIKVDFNTKLIKDIIKINNK